jgi:hypothetical protein
MNPVQNRTGPESPLSHDSQDVTPGDLAAAQLESSTLLPVPAGPTTRVSRLPAPAVSRSSSAGLLTIVVGSVAGRNFASGNCAAREALCLSVAIVALSVTTPHLELFRQKRASPTRSRLCMPGCRLLSCRGSPAAGE